MAEKRVKGIIFDMDNTLLRSHIDFQAMKQEIASFLIACQVIPPSISIQDETTATLIHKALASNLLTAELSERMWRIAASHELAGLDGAELEYGAAELLAILHGRYRMAIITNNATEAAEFVLEQNQVAHYFDHIIGRSESRSLKPAPDSFLYLLSLNPDLAASQWVSIGDSWIDGKASQAADICFIAYQADPVKLNKFGVKVAYAIQALAELDELLIRVD